LSIMDKICSCQIKSKFNRNCVTWITRLKRDMESFGQYHSKAQTTDQYSWRIKVKTDRHRSKWKISTEINTSH